MWNFYYLCFIMRIIARNTLKEFWEKHPDSRVGLLTWNDKLSKTNYDNPQSVIVDFKDADYVGNERIVFNIARNKFRLIASFNYQFNACWIKFIGTHKEYSRIDAKTVEFY